MEFRIRMTTEQFQSLSHWAAIGGDMGDILINSGDNDSLIVGQGDDRVTIERNGIMRGEGDEPLTVDSLFNGEPPPIVIEGVCWPMATNGDESHAWVEMDDMAGMFRDDVAAQNAIVTVLHGLGILDQFRWGMDEVPGGGGTYPYVDPIQPDQKPETINNTED